MITNVKAYQNKKNDLRLDIKMFWEKWWWDFWKIYDLYVESGIEFEFTLFE